MKTDSKEKQKIKRDNRAVCFSASIVQGGGGGGGIALLQFQPIYQAASQITLGPAPSAHSLSQW